MLATNLEKLLKALYDQRVEFVIIGGAAAVLQGSAYVTADLDVCYSREKENLKRIEIALVPFHPSLRGAPKNLPFRLDADSLKSGLNFTLTTDLGDLDLLGELAGLGSYMQVLSFAEEIELFDMRCKVLTFEGLIKNKRAVGRAKDLRLLPELETLLAIRQLQRNISNTAICNAIKNKAVIQFNYDGKLRIVEPQCHGISKAGNEVMRGFQIGGDSSSDRSVAEKLFEVAKMTELRETGDTFYDPGPHYNPNDQAMVYVHCQL